VGSTLAKWKQMAELPREILSPRRGFWPASAQSASSAAVFKRNRQRFPDDFAFQLTAAEVVNLRSQFVTSRVQDVANQEDAANSSQIAMSSSQAVESEGSVPNWSQFATSSYHN
jgi:hypothetical protein